MNYVGGDIVIAGNIFKRLCAGLKSREKYSFFGLEGSVIDGLWRSRDFIPKRQFPMVISWFKKSQNIRFWAYRNQLSMGYEVWEVLFPKTFSKSRKSIRFLAFMEKLLMGY